MEVEEKRCAGIEETDEHAPTAGRWRPARTLQEWKTLMKRNPNETLGLIRTLEDWHDYVREADAYQEHPLADLDGKEIKAFTDSLVFRNGGLAGARYGAMAERVSYRRFRTLWGRFGIGLPLFEAWDNKYCAERATCRTEYAAVCTDNC